MRQGLQEASDRYIPVESNDGVNPISELDARIINQFFSVIEKLTDNKSIEQIMDSYKLDADGDVYDKLTTFNESFTPKGMNARDFVRIKDVKIPVGLINSIEPVDGYDSEANMPTYYILINNTENHYEKLANKQIEFSDPEERDEAIAELETKLEDTGKIRFV